MSKEAAREERIRKLMERARETREGKSSGWEYLIQTDPDMFEAYQNVYEKALMDGRELPIRYRELVCMGILAFRGNREGVIAHARRAHRFVATLQEILEAAETTIVPGGSPTFITYLAGAEAVKEDEMKEKAAEKT